MTHDLFRRQGRLLTDVDNAKIQEFKLKAEELANLILLETPCREYALALTRLEESVMWAVKGFTQ
jgi:hypothetical protein